MYAHKISELCFILSYRSPNCRVIVICLCFQNLSYVLICLGPFEYDENLSIICKLQIAALKCQMDNDAGTIERMSRDKTELQGQVGELQAKIRNFEGQVRYAADGVDFQLDVIHVVENIAGHENSNLSITITSLFGFKKG